MSTTAIGTLIPILSDAGEMRTRFGTYLLAAGAIGEFGPILLDHAVLLNRRTRLTEALLLVGFVVHRGPRGRPRVRSASRGWDALERTLETSAQLADPRDRSFVVFALAALASDLGLDLLLGGFVAGIIVRLALSGREVPVFESQADRGRLRLPDPVLLRRRAGMNFELDALIDDPVSLLEGADVPRALPVVRGAPALLLYRKVLDTARPHGARVLQRHRAAAGRRDHHDRDRQRGDALRRRRPRSSAPRSSRRRSSRSSACACAATGRRSRGA